jgi:hypothetical protein
MDGEADELDGAVALTGVDAAAGGFAVGAGFEDDMNEEAEVDPVDREEDGATAAGDGNIAEFGGGGDAPYAGLLLTPPPPPAAEIAK